MLTAPLAIRFYAQTEITPVLMKWLETHEVYETRHLRRSGLRRLYRSFQTDTLINSGKGVQNWITHLWVACDGEVPIAVGVLQNKFSYALWLYVKEAYRRQGIGEELLKQALAEGRPFEVFYTPTSQHLYDKYHLRDVTA